MRFADLRNEFRALDNCPDSNSIEALSAAITVSTPTSCANSCRSEEHTSELQSLMRSSYAVFCLKKKTYTAISARHITCTEHTLTLDTQQPKQSPCYCLIYHRQ